MKKTGSIISLAAIGVITAVFTAITVVATGPMETAITNFWPWKPQADAESVNASRQEGVALADEMEAEGAVLLKNDNDLLPLAKNYSADGSTRLDKVNVFGWSSTQWIGGGSGSGRVVSSQSNLNVTKGLLEALSEEGIDYNTDLTDMYKKYCSSRPYFTNGTLNSYEYQFYRLIEPDIDDETYYSSELLDDAASYSDTAFVVIGRIAGESSDPTKVQYKGTANSTAIADQDRTYLDISTEEEDLLTYVGANYDNVVVIVNSTNTMNLSFMDDIPGLDACLLVGGTGTESATVVPKILYGDINPSGKLADTYAYDLTSNPSFVNTSNVQTVGTDVVTADLYKNASGLYPNDGTSYGNVGNSNAKYPGVAYTDYCENIYVGYKWYETADTEGYWNDVKAHGKEGYDAVVQYPFGYGQSYTTFDWEVTGLSIGNKEKLTADDEIEVTVDVTNTGTVAGKDVVELYYTAPYVDGQIEKSSVNLGAFAKTVTLEPGKTQTLTLKMSVRDMASYDCYDSNGNGFAGYELDPGEYQLTLRTDSHHIKEVVSDYNSAIKTGTITYHVDSNIQYKTDKDTGNVVSNKFTGEDAVDGIPADGSEESGDGVVYLSRLDFEGTFPEKKECRTITSEVRAKNLYTKQDALDFVDESDEDIGTGASNNIKIYDSDNMLTDDALQLGADYDDPMWDDLLDEMSITEMKNLTLHGYVQTVKVPSINLLKTSAVDGPNQIGSFNVANVGTGFPNETVTAQTWNSTLAYNFGIALGKEAKALGYDGWYGPGLNIHRSPFGGRNYEYFSEDSLLTGTFTAQEVKGAKNCGVYCFLKHLALYEQETYRDGIYTWCTEQALREVYLSPFKKAIAEGGATGIMSSYNRIGAVWSGGSQGLIQGILRDEWGFEGAIITDYADHHAYMNQDQALRAGADLFMDGWNSNGSYTCETSSNTFKQCLRRACKNIIYMIVNAGYTNSQYNASADTGESISIGAKVVFEPIEWEKYLYIADGVVGAGLITWGVFAVLGLVKAAKKKETTL